MSATIDRQRCERATQLMEGAIAEPTSALGEDVDRAEWLLVEVRDELIDALRSGAAADRRPLDRVHQVLSLVAGVEYPLGGLHRDSLRRAADALRRALDEQV